MMVRLLGVPTITIDGKDISSFRSNRIPALIGLLASKPGPWHRETIAGLLWPDHVPSEGRHNLRQTLLYAKELLGENSFMVSRSTIEFVNSDLTDLHLLLKFSEPLQSPAERLEAAEIAICAYRGEFLAGNTDDWVLQTRAQCCQLFVTALLFLSSEIVDSQPLRALKFAELAIHAEPFREGPRVNKIIALRALGEYATAHREFAAYRQLLVDELGLEPSQTAMNALIGGVIEPETAHAPFPEVKDHDEAIESLLQSYRPRRGLDYAIAHSQFLSEEGSVRKAIECLSHALDANQKGPTNESTLMAKVVLAELNLSVGNSYGAKELLIPVLPELRGGPVRIRALTLFARIYSHAYKPQNGRSFAIEAVELAAKSGGTDDLVDASLVAAEIAFQLENLNEAEELAQKAVDFARQIDDWHACANAVCILALIYARSDRLDEAREAMRAAVGELSDKKSRRSAFILVRFARILDEMGDKDEAEKGYRRGIEEARILEDEMALAICQTYLADLLTTKNRHNEALEIHFEALAIRRRLRERLGEATSLRGIGRSQLALGQFEDANQALRESARLYLHCESTAGHASALLELSKVAKASGEPGLAMRIARRTRELMSGMSSLTLRTIGPSGDRAMSEVDDLISSLTVD